MTQISESLNTSPYRQVPEICGKELPPRHMHVYKKAIWLTKFYQHNVTKVLNQYYPSYKMDSDRSRLSAD